MKLNIVASVLTLACFGSFAFSEPFLRIFKGNRIESSSVAMRHIHLTYPVSMQQKLRLNFVRNFRCSRLEFEAGDRIHLIDGCRQDFPIG